MDFLCFLKYIYSTWASFFYAIKKINPVHNKAYTSYLVSYKIQSITEYPNRAWLAK